MLYNRPSVTAYTWRSASWGASGAPSSRRPVVGGGDEGHLGDCSRVLLSADHHLELGAGLVESLLHVSAKARGAQQPRRVRACNVMAMVSRPRCSAPWKDEVLNCLMQQQAGLCCDI